MVADTHWRGTSPRGRLDDFWETCRRKLHEVVALTRELRVDALLHLGDFFDRPDLAPGVVREFAVIMRQCQVPVYGIAGNHDVYGHNPDTLPRTLLGLMEAMGGPILLAPGEKVMLTGDVTVQLTGAPFRYDIDDGDGHHYVVDKDPRADVAIHLAHGMLLEKPWVEGLEYTLIDRVAARTQADLTLVGHYHLGYSRLPLEPVPGHLFVNPGALVRLEASAAEMRRQPQVVLVEARPGARPGAGTVTVRGVPLRSAEPGEKVLDRAAVEAAASRDRQLADFIQRIREASDGFRVPSLEDIVARIAATQGCSPEVREEALRRIGAVRERLAGGQGGEGS